MGTLGKLPPQGARKEGTMSSHHGLYARGYTRTTMVGTKSSHLATRSESQKPNLSSDCRLQLACMKLESLVIAHQQRRGEYVPGPCTHRPSSHGSRGGLKPAAARSRLGQYRRLGLSRNKVAVPEGAAGIPPFWCAAPPFFLSPDPRILLDLFCMYAGKGGTPAVCRAVRTDP